jgi:hypothetical protein
MGTDCGIKRSRTAARVGAGGQRVGLFQAQENIGQIVAITWNVRSHDFLAVWAMLFANHDAPLHCQVGSTWYDGKIVYVLLGTSLTAAKRQRTVFLGEGLP